ncbi:MAG: SDR family oxidoreductase [Phycisphaerales bacterium]
MDAREPTDGAASGRRRVALVTGAGSGIGRAVAIGLAREAFDLALAGRTAAKLEATASCAAGATTLLLAGDVGDAAFAEACVDRCVERFGGLDVLVNAAGIAPLEPIGRTSEDTLRAAFEVNAFGPARLILRAWKTFERQGRGCVVNVSTIGSIDPFPGFFAYAASKAALDSFTRSIAREGAAIGVTAYSVNPGAVETPLLRQLFSERVIPRGRTLSAESVATVVIDCALSRRPGDNGRVIPLPSP